MDAIYRVEGDRALTSAYAGGPWDPSLQHGSAPSSLVVWAAERVAAKQPMRVARLTIDLLRPVPIAPLTIRTELLREGRKIQVLGIHLATDDGVEVVRASVLKMRREPLCLPDSAAELPLDMAEPDLGQDPVALLRAQNPFLTGVSMRVVKGSFLTPGPAAVWFRADRPIVEGAPISPLMRAAIAADFCNGTSSVLDFRRWTFINGDLTISLTRPPVGEWILLDAETWLGPEGGGIAFARLGDSQGYFGRAIQSVIVEPR